MKIRVKVKAGAKVDCVSFDEENGLYIVSTKARPVEGKANEAVIKTLGKHFKVSKSQVVLRIGRKSRIKIFEVID